MGELFVALTPEHLKRTKQTAPDGIKQAIWNSLDADATKIDIVVEKQLSLEGMEIPNQITIRDNGCGIKEEEIVDSFGSLGSSKKTTIKTSSGGRIYHGKNGEGRYSYFSLGRRIRLISVSKNNGIGNSKIEITFCGKNGEKIEYSKPVDTNENPGTVLVIDDLDEKCLDFINDIEAVKSCLLREFSAYLFAYKGIDISLCGNKIEANDYVKSKNEYEKEIGENHFLISAIEWNDSGDSLTYLCGETGTVYFSESISTRLNISVYVMSSFFDRIKKDGNLDNFELTGDGPLIKSFIEESRKAFIEETNEKYKYRIIDILKEDNIYPYANEPTDPITRESKKIYDEIVVNVYKKLPSTGNGSKKSRKLTYSLIYEALNSNPTSLSKILSSVIDLSKKEQDEFAELLNKMALSRIISLASIIEKRKLFLKSLREIVYDSPKLHIKERTEFQPILLNELWIFGDKYTYGADDISLKKLLVKHQDYLGNPCFDLPDDLKNNTDYNKIPDIVLFNRQVQGETFENLVIEIKKPGKVLGQTEIEQIRRYAYTIVADSYFSSDNNKWTFILIGNDYDDYATKTITNKKDKTIWEDNGNVIKVLKWSELIDSNELRYDYIFKQINSDIKETDVQADVSSRLSIIRNDSDDKGDNI